MFKDKTAKAAEDNLLGARLKSHHQWADISMEMWNGAGPKHFQLEWSQDPAHFRKSFLRYLRTLRFSVSPMLCETLSTIFFTWKKTFISWK